MSVEFTAVSSGYPKAYFSCCRVDVAKSYVTTGVYSYSVGLSQVEACKKIVQFVTPVAAPSEEQGCAALSLPIRNRSKAGPMTRTAAVHIYHGFNNNAAVQEHGHLLNSSLHICRQRCRLNQGRGNVVLLSLVGSQFHHHIMNVLPVGDRMAINSLRAQP